MIYYLASGDTIPRIMAKSVVSISSCKRCLREWVLDNKYSIHKDVYIVDKLKTESLQKFVI